MRHSSESEREDSEFKLSQAFSGRGARRLEISTVSRRNLPSSLEAAHSHLSFLSFHTNVLLTVVGFRSFYSFIHLRYQSPPTSSLQLLSGLRRPDTGRLHNLTMTRVSITIPLRGMITHEFYQFLGIFIAFVALCISIAFAVQPIEVQGSDFVNSITKDRLQIIGVA